MNFNNFYKESIINIARNSLDPTVWQQNQTGFPILQTAIKEQILLNIEEFSKITQIKDFFLTGSILTKYYSKESDIDVTIVVYPEDIDQVTETKIVYFLNAFNGRLASGSIYPINYYVLMTEKDESNYDGIYDVTNEKWLKTPKAYPLDVTTYVNKFDEVVSKVDLLTAKLRRDVIDYKELNTFDKEELNNIKMLLQSKIFEINKAIESLIDIKKTIKKSRSEKFSRPLSPDEIEIFKSKNNLPENVIYKLLKKYYYFDFINKLEEIINKDDKIDNNDINDIKNAEKRLYDNFENYYKNVITESKFRVRASKIDWKNPLKSKKTFTYSFTRGMDRKNLQQVPFSYRTSYSSGIGNATKMINKAKTANFGLWRLTNSQVKWIATKYHFIPPNAINNIKHLGNTGIMVWHKPDGSNFLVKSAHSIH